MQKEIKDTKNLFFEGFHPLYEPFQPWLNNIKTFLGLSYKILMVIHVVMQPN
jgi:hypothetical protein